MQAEKQLSSCSRFDKIPACDGNVFHVHYVVHSDVCAWNFASDLVLVCFSGLSSTPGIGGLGNMLPLGIPVQLMQQPPASAMTMPVGMVPSVSVPSSPAGEVWSTTQTACDVENTRDEQQRARELEVEKAERLRLEEERRRQEEERERLAEERRQLEELRLQQEHERQRLEEERQAQELMRKKKEEEARQLAEQLEWQRQEQMRRAAAAAEEKRLMQQREMDALKAKQVCVAPLLTTYWTRRT